MVAVSVGMTRQEQSLSGIAARPMRNRWRYVVHYVVGQWALGVKGRTIRQLFVKYVILSRFCSRRPQEPESREILVVAERLIRFIRGGEGS